MVTQAIENPHIDYQSQLFDTNQNTFSKKFCKYVEGLHKDRTGIAPLKVNKTIIYEGKDKAEEPNDQFFSVFTEKDVSYIP